MDLLEFFVETTKYKGWEKVAETWIITVALAASAVAILLLIYKYLSKKYASTPEKETWTFLHTLVWLLIGLALSFTAFFVLWYTTQNYSFIVGWVGFINGTMLGWAIYLAIALLVHLVVPHWRRELFSRRTTV